MFTSIPVSHTKEGAIFKLYHLEHGGNTVPLGVAKG